MTDDADATADPRDPDDHVARLRAAGRIAGDASREIRSRLSRLMSRFGRGGKK